MSTTTEEAYVRYRADVYRFLLRRTRNECDAEELTQEVFADTISALSRADPPRSMRAWLFAVARRRLIDELWRRRRAAETVAELAPRVDHAVTGELDALDEALRRLPLVQRRIVVMRVLEGRTYREIARELDSNEAACKMRLSRALRRLRDDLQIAS
jgi:RNA polymerase sigma-70 factor, ECF subfamily